MKDHSNNTFADRKTLAYAFIHSVYFHNDYLIIVLNGGKGLVTEENIPLKNIENAFISDAEQTFSSSPVSIPVPPKRMTTRYGWSFFLVSGESKISMQQPGGLLPPPVQKLAAAII